MDGPQHQADGVGGTVPDGSSVLEGGGTQIEAARLAISDLPAPSMQPASLDEFMRNLSVDLADFMKASGEKVWRQVQMSRASFWSTTRTAPSLDRTGSLSRTRSSGREALPLPSARWLRAWSDSAVCGSCRFILLLLKSDAKWRF